MLGGQVIANAAQAVNAVASYLSNPILIFKTSLSANIGAVSLDLSIPSKFVFLETKTQVKAGAAQVSENAIILNGSSKQYVNDNVSPRGWTWDLSGFIPGLPYAETTIFFTPILRYNVAALSAAYEQGDILGFKDSDNKYYNDVVIESLQLPSDADVQDRQPFTMRLREVRVLEGGLFAKAKGKLATVLG